MTEQEAIKILSLDEKEKKLLKNLTPVYEVAIKALKEIQQYRAIGTVEKIREELDRLRNDNECQGLYFTLEERQDLAGQHRELEEYKTIGTPEELQDMKNNYFEALSDWRQYRKIGTPEECRAAVEKQKAKKPFDVSETDENDNAYVECPVCHYRTDYAIHSITEGYCWKCGQLLDWSDEE